MGKIDFQIEALKRRLISNYIVILGIIMITYFFYDLLVFKDLFTAYYILIGFVFILYTWLIIKKRYKIDKVIHAFFIFSPLYNSIIILRSWNGSVVGFIWIIVLPLGAYVFFTRREIIYYTIYSVLYIFVISIIAYLFGFYNPKIFDELDRSKIIISDSVLLLFHSIIIGMVVYYNDKIRNLRIISRIEKTGINVNKFLYSDKEIEKLEEIFNKLEMVLKKEEYFKDSNFNISKMSVHLNINSGYISKSIRYKEFPNFNSYLNMYRIDYAKQLIQNIDYQKLTLLYVYSESGFSNQVTFNRVFKQIEGITPTEYINKLSNKNKLK